MATASVYFRASVRSRLSPACVWSSRSNRHLQPQLFTSRLSSFWATSRCRWPTTVFQDNCVYRLRSTASVTAGTLDGNAGEFQLVYTGPLKGAVRALKIFSLSTAVLASCGGPVLVWLGKESVPVAARLALCSIVLLVGLSTTALLHWLLKGYITHLYYHPEAQRVAAHTLSLLAQRARNEFEVGEIRPPTGLAGFSTFQARDKAYFMHTEVFPNKHLLSALLDSQKN